MRVTVFFSVLLCVQVVVGADKTLNLTLSNPDLQESNKEWREVLTKENARLAQKFTNKNKSPVPNASMGPRKRLDSIVSDPCVVYSQKHTSPHPLMPPREQGKMKHYQ